MTFSFSRTLLWHMLYCITYYYCFIFSVQHRLFNCTNHVHNSITIAASGMRQQLFVLTERVLARSLSHSHHHYSTAADEPSRSLFRSPDFGSSSQPKTAVVDPMKKRNINAIDDELSKFTFVDKVKCTCVGGDGGDGAILFTREAMTPRGGPCGGDGGHGAHVLFQASTSTSSLSKVSRRVSADRGGDGGYASATGACAKHRVVNVPIGTTFTQIDPDNPSIAEFGGDLEKEGDIFIAARGGAGGFGNEYFANPHDTAPRRAECGGKGETATWLIQLKTIAHAGLVGFPNAGKSTLLRAVSRARPKVAPYPFTTLRPHIGVITYDDHVQLKIADIPGLINGAHEQQGLGHDFLQHIERCTFIMYILDGTLDCVQQLEQLQFELAMYNEELTKRPRLLIVNKIDLDVTRRNLDRLRAASDEPVLALSARQQTGVAELLRTFRAMYDTHMADNTHSLT